jgi:uracil-DNA glycosylase family 4
VLFGRDTENERNERVFLDALNALGLSRDDVYVTNLLKCAPERSSLRGKEDRNAIATCVETILHAELTLLQPRLLVAVGEPAQRIFRVRVGQRHELKRDGWPTMEVAAMWHPGALWRRRKQIPEPLAFYVEQMRKALASWANEIESRHRGQKEMAGQQSPRSAPTP